MADNQWMHSIQGHNVIKETWLSTQLQFPLQEHYEKEHGWIDGEN